MSTSVVSTNNTSTYSVRCKSDVACIFTSIVINSCTVTNSVYTWDRCFLFLVYKEGTVAEEFNLTISKSCVRTETNCKNNHVHIKCFFVSYQAFYFAVTLDCFNSLTKCQADVMVFQVLSHHLSEVFVVVAVQDSIYDVNKNNFFSKTFKGFSKLNTNITTTNNSDALKVLALVSKFVDNFFSILVQFNKLNIFKCCFEFTVAFDNFNTFDWWQDWSRSSRKDQFVVRFFVFLTFNFCSHNFIVIVD